MILVKATIGRLLVVLVLAAAGLTQGPAAQSPSAQAAQAPAAPPPAPAPDQAAPAQGQPQDTPQGQPTFRGAIDFVTVDAIVTDGKDAPVLDLTQADFEITEDGKVQSIEQFKLIKVDGNPKANAPPPRQIRSREDEELEAVREDTRVFAILLDDYHTRRSNSISVQRPLTEFVQTQLRPYDMVAVMYPLTPSSDISFTRNHDQILTAIKRFEGRKYDYRPRNLIEEGYQRYSTDVIERIRNDVVMGALRGLAIRLGSLREGRKSLIFVGEGFTAMLPPQMRRMDASAPEDPRQTAAAAAQADSNAQMTAEWFGQVDVQQRMREVTDMANRNNTAIYTLDPRGLAVFEFGMDDNFGSPPSFATDSRALRMTQDTLRILSEDTDGRAIVNRNTLAQGLAQMARDSSFYYLLGYTTTQKSNDGKFHEIKVRVKRRGVDVRARKGYWAMTVEDISRANNPTPDIAKPIQNALATIAPNLQAARYVRTWIGTERGSGGKTKVTLIWEPLTVGARRDPPGRVSLLAADMSGNLLFRGRVPEAAPATPPAGAQRLVFEAPPGKVELRLTVEGTGTTGTLDTETRTIDVPDLTRAETSISTPRLFRGRTVREMQTMAADPAAIPVATREFSRAERILIRFDAYGPGTATPEVSAVLLNRGGQKMSDVPVAPALTAGTHQIDLGFASLAAGEYLVEVTVKGAGADVKELIPLRIVA
jgi:VWFA-related protein